MFVGVKSLHGPEILYHTSLTSHSGSLPPKETVRWKGGLYVTIITLATSRN